MNNRTIVLIDMNAFFAQVEQKHNPALAGKPIFVVGGPDRHSIVTAASYEAKKFGIKAGMPYPEAKRLCPMGLPVIGNQDKYLDYCYRLLAIYNEFTDLVEPFSIDEAFLDITDVENLFGSSKEIALKIKARIREELNLTCSIGIGPNKLIAKMAAEWHKPDGLTIVDPKDVPQIIWHLPVEELVGVGEKMKNHLNQMGIKTIKDLADFPVFLLKSKFGKYGEMLHQYAWGINDSAVHPAHPKSNATNGTNNFAEQWMGGVNPSNFEQVKSVGHSYTLPKDIDDLDVIKWYIFWLSSKVARRLEKDRLAGRTIHLVVRSKDFSTFGTSISISEKTNYPQTIANTAYDLFIKNYAGKKVRLLGVSVSNLALEDNYQLDLFSDKSKMTDVLKSVSEVKDKYGDNIIDLAVIFQQDVKSYIRKKVGCFLTQKEKGPSFVFKTGTR